MRGDPPEDFSTRSRRSVAPEFAADPAEMAAAAAARRRRGGAESGVRFRLGRRIPRSLAGRIAATVAVFAAFGTAGFGLWEGRAALLRDPRLTIPSSRSIEISGNNHLTRAQLLSVFGEDVDRNLLTVPLETRRAELESLPWVEHATVMRLLPHTLRVAITERTPVAFVRQGGEIGLVDANGVLLDFSPGASSDHDYSFPVVSGISAQDPLSVRAARMRLYLHFTGDLDAGPDKVSNRLSEVDLSDPEDVKALIPDNGTDLLVHFGDSDFLARYQRYVQYLPDWKTRFPKLASVDMRSERSVVLEMAPGATVPVAGEAAAPVPAVAKPEKPAVAVKKTPSKAAAQEKPKLKPKPRPAAVPVHHLEQSFDVHPGAAPR